MQKAIAMKKQKEKLNVKKQKLLQKKWRLERVANEKAEAERIAKAESRSRTCRTVRRQGYKKTKKKKS